MAAALLILLALGLGAAAAFYASSAASFTAGALTQLLGRRVEIDELDIRAGRVIEVDLVGLRVFETREPGGAPLFEAPRARGTQSWPRLVAGQLMPPKWELREPVVRVDLGGAEGDRAGPSLPSLPPLDLKIANGTVVIRRGSSPPLRIDGLELGATRSRLRTRVSGAASGKLSIGQRPLAGFAVRVEGWGNDLAVDGELHDMHLEALPLPGQPSWRGLGHGAARARVQGGALETSVDLVVEGFALELPAFREAIAPKRARLVADLSWDGKGLEVRPHPIALDDLVVSGELRITTGPGGRIRGSLMVGDFEPGLPAAGRLHLVSLLGLRHQTWANIDSRTEAGRFEDVRLDLDLPLDNLDGSLAFARKLGEEEFRLHARVRDGVYRPRPESAPLEDLSGLVEIIGNRLELREVRMSRDGKPLPRLDISIDGMHRFVRLPRDERRIPPGPGVPIPGLGAATGALREGRPHDRAPVEIRFENLQIGYPAFVLPVRNAAGVMRFPEGKLVVEDADGVVGGVPARISTAWDPEASTVAVNVRYGDDEAPPPEDPGERWVSGRFAMDAFHAGSWRLDDVEGYLEATGAEVRIPHFDARFAGGRTGGEGRISLAEEAGAPFDFTIGVAEADASGLNEPLALRAGTIEGTLALDGRFAGRLAPGREFLADANLDLAIRLADGSCDHLPVMLVLARLPSLQGLRGLFGAALPFKTVSTEMKIQGGLLRTENFVLHGPELRLLAAGEVDLLSEEKDTDMVVALLFLQTVDRVIGQLPVLGEWVLGEDESLLALYIGLDGPWKNPRARPLPPGVVQTAAGWAGNLIVGGVRQLRKLVLGERDARRREEQSDDGATGPGQDR